MLRITIVFAALTGLLWLADWMDTPDSIPAIKPLFWLSALLLAGLLVRLVIDLFTRPRPGADSP